MKKNTIKEVEEIHKLLLKMKPVNIEKLISLYEGKEDQESIETCMSLKMININYDQCINNMIFGNRKTKKMGFETLIKKGMYSKVNAMYDSFIIDFVDPCYDFFAALKNFPEAAKVYGEDKILSQEEISDITEKVASYLNRAMIRYLPNFANIIDENFNEIIGQDGAKAEIKKLLIKKNLETAVSDKEKVLTMLLTGPTGTGKTQSAKNIAKIFTGNEKNMFRIDMNEFRGSEVAINAIKGMPYGYRDSEIPSPFISFISSHSNGVILLDEFEKAPVDVRNLFYKVIDEAKFEDYKGKKYDLSKFIIILTTNAYARNQENIFGVKEENKDSKTLIQRLNDKLGSALVGRINSVIEFKEFSKEEALDIVKLNLNKNINDKINHIKTVTNVDLSVRFNPSIDEFAAEILKKNEEQFKQNGARIIVNDVNHLYDEVIPTLAEAYQNVDVIENGAEIVLEIIDGDIEVSYKINKPAKLEETITLKR